MTSDKNPNNTHCTKERQSQKKAIFLVCDGTIIEDHGYLNTVDKAVFFPETLPALRLLQRDHLLFIVTQQYSISQGLLTHEQVEDVNADLVKRLAVYGIRIEAVYCCPHQDTDNCACIKPNPYFLEKAAVAYNLDLAHSFVIGDHPHDITLGTNAGATGVYMLTGHGTKHQQGLTANTQVTANIWEAALRVCEEQLISEMGNNFFQELKATTEALRNGGIAAFPTETVYGLGADAQNAKAVAKIFEAKSRPHFDPLIVHVAGLDQVSKVTADFPSHAQELTKHFWPGPLTLVLPKTEQIPDIVTAGMKTVAVRMPEHPVALSLIRRTGLPLAAPSANLFSQISPTCAKHVQQQLGDRVDAILDGGACRVGVESTIISIINNRPVLLRAGGIPIEDIEAVIGPVARIQQKPNKPAAPGQLDKHYAPGTTMSYASEYYGTIVPQRTGFLAFTNPPTNIEYAAVEVLSKKADLTEAATNLFAAMHRLDALDLELILVDSIPGTGLGLAINDRLRRACYKNEH